MKKINVIDLDNTLIPFDSFGYYVLKFLSPQNILFVTFLVIIRKFRIISSSDFKRQIVCLYRKRKKYNKEMNKFAEYLYCKRNLEIMRLVESFTDMNTDTIILSASPIDYVQHLSNILGWDTIASDIQGGEIYHVYGKNKIDLLKLEYPPCEYLYNFSISDHKSDVELLKLFRYGFIYSNKKIEEI